MDDRTILLILGSTIIIVIIIYYIFSDYNKVIYAEGTRGTSNIDNYTLSSTQVPVGHKYVTKTGYVNSVVKHDAASWSQSLGGLSKFTITNTPFYGTPDKSCGSYVNLNSFVKPDGISLDKKILDYLINNQCSDKDKNIQFAYSYEE
jgi:hypothetical protein